MIISANSTWSSATPINLTSNVQIASGATLTISPGTIVNGNGYSIQTFGTLNAVGTASSEIQFNNVNFDDGGYSAATAAYIDIGYSVLNGGSFMGPNGNGTHSSFSLSNSIIKNSNNYIYVWYPTGNCYIEGNVFYNSGGISDGIGVAGSSTGPSVYVENNVFYKQTTPYAVQNWVNYSGQTVVTGNSFLSTNIVALSLELGYSSAAINTATGNYFGTTDASTIRSMVVDQTVNLNAASVINFQPYLAAPASGAPKGLLTTAAYVASNIDSIEQSVSIGAITWIILTDTGTPTITVTAAQQTADAAAIADIVSPYTLSVPPVAQTATAAIAAYQAGTLTTQVSISDSAANVAANIDNLETLASKGDISTINFTDSGTPAITVTLSQYLNDGTAFSEMALPYSISLTHVSASSSSIYTNVHVKSISVSDTAANVAFYLNSLETVAAAGSLSSITLTDSSKPTLSITAAQQTADAAAIADIGSPYTLSVESGSSSSALTAAAAIAAYNVGSLPSGSKVSDSAADVSANLDGLHTLAAAGAIASIVLTDGGTPTLSLTVAQLTADSAVINDISGSYSLTVAAGTSAVSIAGPAGHATTVQFNGDASLYTIGAANSSITVASGSVTDTLSDVAAIQFADIKEIVAAPPGPASAVTTGNVTELYSAVLAREPDLPGLSFYQSYLAANPNTPLQQFAVWFLSSTEYTSEHSYAQSTVGDEQFITDSYTNLLHRTPSASEVSFYETNVLAPAVANLTPGTRAYASAALQAHALMLVYFSASAEFLSDVQVTAANPPSAQHWLVLT